MEGEEEGGRERGKGKERGEHLCQIKPE